MTHDNPKLNLPKGWRLVPLNRVADIIPSNVDKKIYAHELPIRLCNYMDVYSNNYLSRAIQFSSGSVTLAELQKFRLKQEDVIITKDSETPDDIAVPAVVIEDLGNVVCGYHLALLRPNGEITGTYLSKALQTHLCRRHFGNSANGATRYGLTQKVISRCPILLPTQQEQARISQILTTLDQAIEKSEHIINKYERIKTGLMQDLLTRGIDEQGNIRSEKTHEFKDSPLGRIPKDWEVKKLGECCDGRISYGINSAAITYSFEFPTYLRITDIDESGNLNSYSRVSVKYPESGSYYLNEEDVVFARTGNTTGKSYYHFDYTERLVFAGFLVRARTIKSILLGKYLFYFSKSHNFKKWVKIMSMRSGQPGISGKEYESLKLPLPKLNEQKKIVSIIDKQNEMIQMEKRNLGKLVSQKTGLMQDLLTGKVSVNALLKRL